MVSLSQSEFADRPFLFPGERETDEAFRPGAIGPLLRDIFSAVRRNTWLIIATIIVVLVLAAIATMLMTPKYAVTATVEINDRSAQVLGDEMEPVTEDLQGWDVDRFLNTQLRILESRTLAERVARRLDLFENSAFLNAMQVPAPEEYPSDGARRDAVIRLLMTHFETSLPGDSRIAELTFTSIDPKVSTQVVNAFSQEFIQANLQRRYESSTYARNFVEQQLEEARARLENSELELNAYAREAGLIRSRGTGTDEPSASGSVTTDSLMQLNQTANTASSTRIAAEAEWAAEQAQSPMSSPAALSSPAVQQLLARRSVLQEELASARSRYLADHPGLTALEGDLRSVENALHKAAAEARNGVRTRMLAARKAEGDLLAQVSRLQGATLAEQERSVRYNTLAREADTNRSIYDGLLQRYREINAAAGITASNVAIIDPGVPPVQPTFPNPILNMAVALAVGVAMAILIVTLKEQLDDRIRVPEDVESKVGLHLLGVIPKAETENPRAELLEPKSPIAEAYGALRSSLFFATREGLPKLLLVTSSQASEGKSLTSYAIALGLAQIGKRTLLLDADLRRPTIHKIAGGANQAGLSTVLVGETPIADAVLPTPVNNLSILPSGPLPPNPAELLSSPRLGSILRSLGDRFDAVIIDSAPVLGLADTPGLAALVDGVLLVIEAEGGRGGHLKSAVRRLRLMRPNLVGAVLTKYDPDKAGNSYSSYYSYDYYSYRSNETEAAA